MQMCHCGKPLHYSSKMIQRKVEGIVEKQGEFVPVKIGDRTWLVQRHYIALHGLKARELPSLGFEEVI